MEFACLQENLQKGLTTVSKAVSIKSPLPILSNVLIVAEKGGLKLSASNLDTSISTKVGASVEKEGAITVPAKLLTEFISHLSPGTVSGKLKGNILHISSGKASAKFNGVDAAGYPELVEESKGEITLELSPAEFSEAVMSVGFSAALDDSRPVLGGILLNFEKNPPAKAGTLTIVSADGVRLSEKSIIVEGKSEEFKVIIPAKTLMEVVRILGNSPEPIKFALNEGDNLAVFESNGILISTRIIDGTFPDYKKLIPEKTTLSAEFSTQDLLEAVKLTSVFAKELKSAITLVFDPDGSIELSSVSQETGGNKSELAAKVTGKKLEMSFNAKYLLDFLNNVKAETLIFSSNGELTPGVLKPANEDGYVHLIMPVRKQPT